MVTLHMTKGWKKTTINDLCNSWKNIVCLHRSTGTQGRE